MKDEWIENNSPIELERLHALGVLIFRWNTSEMLLYALMATFADTSWRTAWSIGHELGDRALADAIRNLLKLSSWEDRITNHIKSLLDVYDKNRINRNQLTHFTASGGENGVEFFRVSGADFNPQPIPSDVQSIRRVCGEVDDMNKCLVATLNWFSRLRIPRNSISALEDRHLPLPEIPPLPELVWKPPQKPPKTPKQKRPPQSSRP